MPIEPNGTSPISTLWPDSLSHSSEPTRCRPRTARAAGCTRLVAAQHVARVRRQLREDQRAEEPEPRDAEDRQEYGAGLCREADDFPGLGDRIEVDLERRSTAGARNAARARYVATASRPRRPQMRRSRSRRRPPPLVGTSRPPAIVPTRIARNVPFSTSALPPTSSSGAAAAAGAYLIGPKNVECTPIRKSRASSVGMCP